MPHCAPGAAALPATSPASEVQGYGLEAAAEVPGAHVQRLVHGGTHGTARRKLVLPRAAPCHQVRAQAFQVAHPVGQVGQFGAAVRPWVPDDGVLEGGLADLDLAADLAQHQLARRFPVDAVEFLGDRHHVDPLLARLVQHLVVVVLVEQAFELGAAHVGAGQVGVQGGLELERRVAAVDHRQLHLEAAAVDADRQFERPGMRPDRAGLLVVPQRQHGEGVIAAHGGFFQRPGAGPCEAVARQRAHLAELREDHRHAAANGRVAVQRRFGREVELFLVAGRDPGHDMRTLQQHGGLRAVGRAQVHGGQSAELAGAGAVLCAGLLARIGRRRHAGQDARSASRAAAMVASMSASVWAALTKPAS